MFSRECSVCKCTSNYKKKPSPESRVWVEEELIKQLTCYSYKVIGSRKIEYTDRYLAFICPICGNKDTVHLGTERKVLE